MFLKILYNASGIHVYTVTGIDTITLSLRLQSGIASFAMDVSGHHLCFSGLVLYSFIVEYAVLGLKLPQTKPKLFCFSNCATVLHCYIVSYYHLEYMYFCIIT